MHMLNTQYEVTVNYNSARNDPKKYIQALKKVCTITSAEELGYFLHHLKDFDSLISYNINIFKKGIDAYWEHESNAEGCSWIVNLKLEYSKLFYERLCVYMCLVGFKTLDCNGIKINIRRGFVKFEIWASKLPKSEQNNNVIDDLRKSFGLEQALNFGYQSHRELLNKFDLTNQ